MLGSGNGHCARKPVLALLALRPRLSSAPLVGQLRVIGSLMVRPFGYYVAPRGPAWVDKRDTARLTEQSNACSNAHRKLHLGVFYFCFTNECLRHGTRVDGYFWLVISPRPVRDTGDGLRRTTCSVDTGYKLWASYFIHVVRNIRLA